MEFFFQNLKKIQKKKKKKKEQTKLLKKMNEIDKNTVNTREEHHVKSSLNVSATNYSTSKTLLYKYPENVRILILRFLGFIDTHNICLINKEHSNILMINDNVSKPLICDMWKLSNSIIKAVNNDEKFKWFDIGILGLSLYHDYLSELFHHKEKDMSSNHSSVYYKLPSLYQEFWIEERWSHYYAHPERVLPIDTNYGITFDYLLSKLHYSRILQNALAPNTIHDDKSFQPPNFESIFYGLHIKNY